MTLQLKVGQRQVKKTDSLIASLESLITVESQRANDLYISNYISFGDKTIKLQISPMGYINQLIAGAFVPSNQTTHDFSLIVSTSNNFTQLIEMIGEMFANPVLNFPLKPEHTHPFRIMLCENQGQIYIYDTINRTGLIFLREESKLDFRSYITPFRLMFSWFANHLKGEILHASAISISQKTIIINGEKGSGKSTLALCSLNVGFQIISDDAVLAIGNQIFAIYGRAKLEQDNQYTKAFHAQSFSLYKNATAKRIVPLNLFGDSFALRGNLHSIVLPIRFESSRLQEVTFSDSVPLFVDNSLREIFGGLPSNRIRHLNLLRSNSRYILYSGSNIELTLSKLKRLLDEI